MSNPYAFQSDVAAIDAPVDARVQFLKKTYSLVFLAVLEFVATIWAVGNIAPVREMAYGLNVSPWIYIILFIGVQMAVHAVAETKIGLPVFIGAVFVMGLLIAPLILTVGSLQDGVAIINQAAIITVVTFTGLTLYVFKSGKDFAFLGGILFTLMIGMFGLAIAGLIFGFPLSIWFCYLGAAVFAGYMLYDTSNILRRFPTTAHVSAAMILFVDIVIFFKYIVMILANRD